MQGSAIAAYLKELCHSMDVGRPLRRFDWRRAAAQAVIPMALGLGGLGCDALSCSPRSEAVPAYGVPDPAIGEPVDPSPPVSNEPNLSPTPTKSPGQVAPEAVDAYGVQVEPTKTPPGQSVIPGVAPQVGPQTPPNNVAPEPVGAYGAPPAED